MVEEFDYYNWNQREKESYDPEEVPYEPLAPDLAGQSPLASWRNTEAKPTRFGGQVEKDSGMQLREASAIGASPTPEQEQVQGGAEAVTVPTHYLPRSVEEAADPNSNYNILTGGGKPITQATTNFWDRGISAVSRIASRAADVFYRSRGGQ